MSNVVNNRAGGGGYKGPGGANNNLNTKSTNQKNKFSSTSESSMSTSDNMPREAKIALQRRAKQRERINEAKSRHGGSSRSPRDGGAGPGNPFPSGGGSGLGGADRPAWRQKAIEAPSAQEILNQLKMARGPKR